MDTYRLQERRMSKNQTDPLPEFEAFDADVSEIRFKASAASKIYRIYGAFWPEGQRYSYTFLLGKNKKVDNDKKGKREAEKRLKRLRAGKAKIHEFKFKNEPD
jgi:hypothetical protein